MDTHEAPVAFAAIIALITEPRRRLLSARDGSGEIQNARLRPPGDPLAIADTHVGFLAKQLSRHDARDIRSRLFRADKKNH